MGYCDWYAEYVPGPPPPICKAKDEAGEAVEEAAGDAFEGIVNSFADGSAMLLKELATFWMDIDAPTLDAESGPISFLFQNTLWLTSWVAVLGLLIAAGRMAWERRAEPAKEAAVALIRMVLASTAVVAGINLVLKAGDEFSIWIVNRAIKCDGNTASEACLSKFTKHIVTSTSLDGGGGLGLALLLVLSLLLIISSLLQIAFMLCRNALLIPLVGLLPIAAAASSTPTGRQWWQKQIAWILALALYKPAGAVVFAAAFTSAGTGKSGDTITRIAGVVLLALSALTLPALMRVAVPAVESVASGQKGAGSVIASTAAAVATGAVAIKTMGASKAGAAAKGPSGGNRPGGGAPGGPPQGGSGGSPQGGDVPGGSQGGGSQKGSGGSPQGSDAPGGSQSGGSQSGSGGSPQGGAPQSAGRPSPNGSGSGGQTTTVPRPTQGSNNNGGPRGSN